MIIGICGKKGSGKSFTANLIVNNSTGTVKKSLADPVKHMAQYIYDLTWDEVYNPNYKEVVLDRFPFLSPRVILQKLGTEIGREIGTDTWVEFLKRNTDPASDVIIDDIRFPNELSHCDYLIYIKTELDYEANDGHASENSISAINCDYVIDNTKLEEDLELYEEEVMRIYNKCLLDNKTKTEAVAREEITERQKEGK